MLVPILMAPSADTVSKYMLVKEQKSRCNVAMEELRGVCSRERVQVYEW